MNVLVTAWNDSGAGRFMRLMDGADQIFSFPFELLLGAESQVGIQNKASLVSCKYRWNVFRDTHQFQAALEQENIGLNALDPSESELKDWLASCKFHALSQYRDHAKVFFDGLEFQPLEQRKLLRIDAVLAYIKSMKAIFAGHDEAINLIHTPCAALDWEHPQFWSMFSKVILVVINPKWGFGNMHSRNQISPHRYLERWLCINQASLRLKKKYPELVQILLSSPNPTKQADNVALAHDFLGIKNMKDATKEPTLLGEAMGELGFPFGGIVSWSLHSYQNSIAEASLMLANTNSNTVDLLDRSEYLFKLLES